MGAWAFSGPLPPPSLYNGYDLVHKGSAERILSMAESEQAHRFEWERKELDGKISDMLLGKWLAFGISAICVGSAVLRALSGQHWVAGVPQERAW